MDVHHAIKCKIGGLVTIPQDDLLDLTANLLSNMCNDFEIDLKLLPITGQNFLNRRANSCTKARLDIRSRGFWVSVQQAFFDPKKERLTTFSNN